MYVCLLLLLVVLFYTLYISIDLVLDYTLIYNHNIYMYYTFAVKEVGVNWGGFHNYL